MKRFPSILLLVVLALACGVAGRAQERARRFVPVTDAMLQKPDPGDWLMWRRTPDGWGYSPLTQINRNNVAQLRMVWAHGLGPGNQEGTPLVHDGVMYLPNPGDYIIAIDAKTGDVLWEYKRKLPEGVRRQDQPRHRDVGQSGSSTRARTTSSTRSTRRPASWPGKPRCSIPRSAPRPAAGPIIANGKVITGRQCQPDAGRDSCIVTAHDAKTGKELWRFYTIPGPGEPGDETWGNVPMNERWHVGTWMVPSYDPELNLIYVGTSVTIPAPKFTLAGNDMKHLYHNCTLAINADTGKLVWYYQHVVDHWDLDHPFERILVDTAVAPNPRDVMWINPKVKPGERRKVITGIPGKTGLVYTLDRPDGRVPLGAADRRAERHQHDRWQRRGHRQPGGAVHEDQRREGDLSGQQRRQELAGRRLQPADQHDVHAAAEHVHDGDHHHRQARSVEGLRPQHAGSSWRPATDKVGTVWAISAETGTTTWKHEQRAGMMSLVATGGGLVFGGDANGRFKALDDRTGKVLWDMNLGSIGQRLSDLRSPSTANSTSR